MFVNFDFMDVIYHIFNKFKDLNKGVECALNLPVLLKINQTARFCYSIKGFNVVLEAAPHVNMQYCIWLWIIVNYTLSKVF